MQLACCTWALAGAEANVLAQIAAIGFRWIDIRSVDFTATASLERITAQQLQVSCVGLSFALPAEVGFDSPAADRRALALAIATTGLRHGAALGASAAYVIPGIESSQQALIRYTDTLTQVADEAAALGIKLCVEHFPGRALPTVAGMLAYLQAINHPNLYLLFDIGHAQLAQEDPVAALAMAGDRLGYVHLDDNDGERDLHWALLEGVMTRPVLTETLHMLRTMNYTGGVSLELSPQLPDAQAAIQRSWAILKEVLDPDYWLCSDE